jgi:hypothetical protein
MKRISGAASKSRADDSAPELNCVHCTKIVTLNHCVSSFKNRGKNWLLDDALHIGVEKSEGGRGLARSELFLLTKPTYRRTSFHLRQRRNNLFAVIFGVRKSNHFLTALLLYEELGERACVDEMENLEPPSVTQDNLRGRCTVPRTDRLVARHCGLNLLVP